MRKLTLIIIYFFAFYVTIAIINSIFGNGDIHLASIIHNKINEAVKIGKLYDEVSVGLTEGQPLFGSKYYIFSIVGTIFVATSIGQFFLWLIGSEGSFKKELLTVQIITSILTIIIVFLFFLLILGFGMFPSPYGAIIDLILVVFMSAVMTLVSTLSSLIFSDFT